jgi:hypothetical protein
MYCTAVHNMGPTRTLPKYRGQTSIGSKDGIILQELPQADGKVFYFALLTVDSVASRHMKYEY